MKHIAEALATARPAEEMPCAKCKTPMQVEGSTIEFVARMNRLRDQAGVPLARKSDGVTLCPPCYEAARVEMLQRQERESDSDVLAWQRFLDNKDWPFEGSNGAHHDEKHEKAFFDSLYDAASFKSIVYRVKDLRKAQRRKSKGKGSKRSLLTGGDDG